MLAVLVLVIRCQSHDQRIRAMFNQRPTFIIHHFKITANSILHITY